MVRVDLACTASARQALTEAELRLAADDLIGAEERCRVALKLQPGLADGLNLLGRIVYRFATTIRDNIAFGRPGADNDAIIAAAHAANIWEFIESLPHGLNTLVGERGVQFSDGQKQRLAIALALLRHPRVFILDEPTAALDARTEHLLHASVQRADRILAIHSGRIVQSGTHGALLAEERLSRELHDLQSQVWQPVDVVPEPKLRSLPALIPAR